MGILQFRQSPIPQNLPSNPLVAIDHLIHSGDFIGHGLEIISSRYLAVNGPVYSLREKKDESKLDSSDREMKLVSRRLKYYEKNVSGTENL